MPAGGVQDHQMVMDFIPAALFPNEERTVVEFMTSGVSMGGKYTYLIKELLTFEGHVTWRLLREGEFTGVECGQPGVVR